MTKSIEMRRWDNGAGVDLEIRSEYGGVGQLVSLTSEEIGRLMDALNDYRLHPTPDSEHVIFAGCHDPELPFGHPGRGYDDSRPTTPDSGEHGPPMANEPEPSHDPNDDGSGED